MPSPRNTSACAARAINVAVGLVEQQEERLRGIIVSKQATPQEKFEAIVDLAHLAGILLHEMAEAESEIPVDSLPQTPPAIESEESYLAEFPCGPAEAGELSFLSGDWSAPDLLQKLRLGSCCSKRAPERISRVRNQN